MKEFNVYITAESRRMRLGKLLFTAVLLAFGAVLSHVIAASWLIEFVFVMLVTLINFAIFNYSKPIRDRIVKMDKVELQSWLNAGCPEIWP